MRRTIPILMLTLFALSFSGPRAARADDAMVAGVRGDFIASLHDAGDKVQELAAAIPAGKYTWAPAKGVRSVAEVMLHVVTANEAIPMMLGSTPPTPGKELMALEKSTTDKAKIATMLKDSYAFAAKVIADTPDSELDNPVEIFGRKMSKRAALLVMVSHSHEHLGQSIAYARSLGITPPWTARQTAEEAEKMKAKKAAETK